MKRIASGIQPRRPTRKLKVGDTVRVVKMPPGLVEGKLRTKSVFRRCLGNVFPIIGFQKVGGLQEELVELEVGKVVGKAPYAETIWIEQEYVELILYSKKGSTK